MRVFASVCSVVLVAVAVSACGEKGKDEEEEADAITSSEEALASLPASGQLAIDVQMVPAEAAALVDDTTSECDLLGGFASLPCSVEESIGEMAGLVSEMIESLKKAPSAAGDDGAWVFTSTVTSATAATDEDKERLQVYCGDDGDEATEEKTLALDQSTIRMVVKRRAEGGVDLSMDGVLKDGTVIPGIFTGNWLAGADGQVGKGSIIFDFAKSNELTLKQFAEAGQDPAVYCTVVPTDKGTMSLNVDNVSTPRTSGFALSADYADPEASGQDMRLTHYATETLMTMTMKSHYAGADDQDPFASTGDLLEDVSLKMVIKQGEGEAFRFVTQVEATGGDRAGKEAAALKLCARWETDKMVEGYIGFIAPAAYKQTIDDAVAGAPDDETLDAYRPASEAEYCPTLTEATL